MLKEIGVTQVTIPLPFRLNHVHCFLAEGADGWTIMDAGLNTETSMEIWKPFIERYPIKNILISHYHPDHFGYAGTLQRLTGAEVWMTEVDETAGLTSWEPSPLNLVKESYFTCGLPNVEVFELTGDEASFQAKVKPYPYVSNHLEEGMKLKFGKYEYEVIFTPGHSDGLVTLYNKENSILFSTDHILPRISPNISYWFRGIPNPLEAYFQSLEKIKVLDAEYVIPSHGKPFRNANNRIEELFNHHQRRLKELYDYMKEPKTIYQACQYLFQQKLTTHEARFAIGETLAHLEYLYYHHVCEKFMKNGTWFYKAL